MDEYTKSRFLLLTAEWKYQFRFCSHTPMGIKAYQDIIEMGEEVLPLIFQSMIEESAHWFHALHMITGQSPVPPEHAGRVKLMERYWIDWAVEKGYIK